MGLQPESAVIPLHAFVLLVNCWVLLNPATALKVLSLFDQLGDFLHSPPVHGLAGRRIANYGPSLGEALEILHG